MKREKGSITVEASIVVVVALGMTFLIFFLAAYLYDMHRLQAISAKSAWEAWAAVSRNQSMDGYIDWERWEQKTLFWRLTDNFSEQEQAVLAALKKECGNMWFGNTCTFQVELSADCAKITYEGTYRFPVQTGFGAERGLPFCGSVELSESAPEEWIRLIGGVVRGFGGEEEEHGN